MTIKVFCTFGSSKTQNASFNHLWLLGCIPVPLHTINEVISRRIAAKSDISIVDLVLRQDRLHCVGIKLTLCTLEIEDNK